MRARYPDHEGHVTRDGVRLGYEVFGSGDITVLLLPTWTIIHSRFWKMQVPYLSRHYRVITYDGPGNGRSDRVTDPARYVADSYAADAVAVMDATDAERAVAVGLSLGGLYGARLAALAPDRITAVAMIGPSIPIGPAPDRTVDYIFEPYPDEPEGWFKYNVQYWHDHYEDFSKFFWEQCFNEPHSTKPQEDAFGWSLESGPEVLEAEARSQALGLRGPEVLDGVDCPVLVIQGTDDEIAPHAVGEEVARLSNGTLVSLEGSGHIPNVRDPVKVNNVLKEFIDSLHVTTPISTSTESDPPAPARTHLWVRGMNRRKRVLYMSSPIGLGHANRDFAIVEQLRQLNPDVEVEWLAQHPVAPFLEARGETIHPASHLLASESGHIASEAAGHDLHCFQALRTMDEILLANFMLFQEALDGGNYDLTIGDEAWDVDYYWHENPELKSGTHVWLTDFVGFVPMPDGGDHEAFLTADYNAEMIEHIARYPRIRDRAVFVGNPDDIIPETFGPGLPKIRDWTEEHFDFSGYITGFTPPTADQIAETREEFGYGPDEKICIVTVGGSGVGRDLLARTIDAFPIAKRSIPGLRMIAVAGPRIDPETLPRHDGLEIRGYVDRLYRHLAVCDLAVVQGGLTTTMELAAAKRPFLYFPLTNHFEQNYHVRHRLDQYGAGRCMDYRTTDADALAAAIVAEVGSVATYRDVETDGAARAAAMIAELL